MLADMAGPVTEFQKWNLLVGFVLPPLLAVVQQRHWPTYVRTAVCWVACAAAAVGTTYWQGTLHWSSWATSALTIVVAATATYHGGWQPSGIAPAIERRTTVAPPVERRARRRAGTKGRRV